MESLSISSNFRATQEKESVARTFSQPKHPPGFENKLQANCVHPPPADEEELT